MAQEYRHKDDRGNMFVNTSKEERSDSNPNWPDFQGDCAIICRACGQRGELEVAGWNSESNAGGWYLAMRFQDKQERRGTSQSKMGQGKSNPSTESEPPEDESPRDEPPPHSDEDAFN